MITNIFEYIGIPIDYVVIGLIVIQLIMMILLICSLAKIGKMKKNYKAFLSGKDGKSLEDTIIQKFNIIDLLDTSVKDIYAQLKDIDRNLLISFQKIGLVKYDAFKEVGGKMSFVLVLLSKENNGIIMNCMHSNSEGCYTYVKRVTKERALSLAISNNGDADAEIL